MSAWTFFFPFSTVLKFFFPSFFIFRRGGDKPPILSIWIHPCIFIPLNDATSGIARGQGGHVPLAPPLGASKSDPGSKNGPTICCCITYKKVVFKGQKYLSIHFRVQNGHCSCALGNGTSLIIYQKFKPQNCLRGQGQPKNKLF